MTFRTDNEINIARAEYEDEEALADALAIEMNDDTEVPASLIEAAIAKAIAKHKLT